MKKKIFSILALTIVFAMAITMLNTVSAALATEAGKVEDITSASAKDETDKTVTLTYTEEELNDLKWYDKDDPTGKAGLERPASGWWIGVKVTAPDSVNQENVAQAKYKYSNSSFKSFKNALDDAEAVSNLCCTHWLGIDNNDIENHKGETEFTLETITYDWDGDETPDLTVIIKVKPENVVLTENPTGSESRMVTVDVDGTKFTLKKGSTLNEGLSASDLAKLNAMIPENGILVDEETGGAVDLDVVIDSDKNYTIKVIETPAPETPAPEATADELDNTPKTGVVDTTLAVTIIASISLAGIVAIKKYSK